MKIWTNRKSVEAIRNDIKSYGKIAIFSKLQIAPETPPPLS